MVEIQRIVSAKGGGTPFLLRLVAVVLFVTSPSLASGSRLDAVRVNPKARVDRAVPSRSGVDAADTVSAAIAARLWRRVASSPAVRRPASAVPLTPEQQAALGELQQRVQTTVDVRLRPGVGTPMQIRGRTLEPAAHSPLAGDAAERTGWNFLRANRRLLRLTDPDRELVLQRSETDTLGRRHLRYQQAYKGLPVWPAELIVHLDPSGNVDLMDGAFVATPAGMTTEPSLDATAAIARARAAVHGGDHARASRPQLIIYAPGDQPARLGWKLELDLSLAAHWAVVIDALNGATLAAFNQVTDVNVHGSGLDLFNDTQPLNVWEDTAGTFFMVDTTKPMFDAASTPPSPATTRGAIIVQDAQNQPPGNPSQSPFPQVFDVTSASATSGWLPDAVSAATSLGEVYDYYLQRHGRNSIDGQGGTILALVRFGQNYDNAFWSSALNLMVFGDAHPWAGALDVVGHELTHGVTSYTANLIYQDQSGALNEAMSDIFGESIEAVVQGRPDWLIGENAEAIRSMSDPAQFGQPSKMSEFVVTDTDQGGVHTNSGIINLDVTIITPRSAADRLV
ncbi:MAG: M4 family metallopeptidase [Candidatus Binatia bacterium]